MSRVDRQETVEIAARVLINREEIHTAVLYGSVLTDRFADHSDVDVAIAGRLEFSYDELLAVSDTIGHEVGREVQVRDLRRLEGLILREVLLEGSVVKNGAPDFLGRRIADMLDFTEDWLPTLRAIQEANIRKFAYDE
ncbi:MAG: nucleotidyltransferase domain-containing protein, partial [Spirochaetia bacterium]